MAELLEVLAAVNAEKRDMVNRGTAYRRDTAIYASNLLQELVSSNYAMPLMKADLMQMLKTNYQVDEERTMDVAKTILVQTARIDDWKRLAGYYEEAEKRLNSRR